MRFEALKVGELAKRTELTVRTLHHYDEIGLETEEHGHSNVAMEEGIDGKPMIVPLPSSDSRRSRCASEGLGPRGESAAHPCAERLAFLGVERLGQLKPEYAALALAVVSKRLPFADCLKRWNVKRLIDLSPDAYREAIGKL